MARTFDPLAFTYAHRGLWTQGTAPENTMTAFRNAANAGLGIEYDVRPASDGTPMLFHDKTLERLTHRDDPVETLDKDTLSALKIEGSNDTIPTLADLLAEWPADLPLLTEMKIDGQTDPVAFAKTVGDMLLAHDGCAAAMSFSEDAVNALPEGVMRGQLILPRKDIGKEEFAAILGRALEQNVDYIAVNVSDMTHASDTLLNHPQPLVTWTVRTENDVRLARLLGVAIIYEGVPLELAKGHVPT
ncbi:MAG: glycerophosphodiester phosphodiesterase family protein [Hyphomonas sp.]